MFGRREFIAGATAALATACTSGATTSPIEPSPPTTPPPTTTTTLALLDPLPTPAVDSESTDFFGLGVASGDPDTASVVLWTRLLVEVDSSVPVVWELTLPEIDDFSSVLATGVVDARSADAHSIHAIAGGLAPNSSYIYRFRSGEAVSAVGRTKTMPTDQEAVVIGVSSCQRRQDGFWQVHSDIALADLNLMVWLGDYVYRVGEETTPDLAGYRQLYASYKTDPALQASHASCPWFMGVDDNDVVNDYTAVADIGAEQITGALQAWWEHQPTRLAKPTGPELDVYRHLDVGTLGRIVMLDTRQYSVPGVNLLGAAQQSWFESTIESDHTWTFVASPVVVSELVPGSPELVPYAWPAHTQDRQWLRDQLLRPRSPIVLSGDLHTSMATNVANAAGDPIAPELMASSVSSGFPPELAEVVPLLPFLNPRVEYIDPRPGWLRLSVTPDQVEAEFRATDATVEGDPVLRAATYLISSDGLMSPSE